MRFVHLSDAHIGFEQYQCEQRKLDFMNSFQWIIDDILRLNSRREIDFALMCGDIFHHKYPDYKSLSFVKNQLMRLADVGIYIIACTGNHDHTQGMTWIDYFGDLVNSRFNEYEYNVQCLNWSTDIVDRAKEIKPKGTTFNILMIHQGLDEYSGKLSRKDIEAIKNNGFDYLALGHIHLPYSVDNFAYNPGSPEYTSIENWGKPGGYFLWRSDGKVKHVVSPHRDTFRYRIDVSKLDKNDILDYISNGIAPTKDSLLHIDLTGDSRVPNEIIKKLELELVDRFELLRAKVKNCTEDEAISYEVKELSESDVYSEVFGDKSKLVMQIIDEVDNPQKIADLCLC